MKIKVNDKEYTIKYGIEATAKSGIIGKVVAIEDVNLGFESLDSIVLTIAELLLVGLQSLHSDEFGYDLNTKDGFDEAMSKVCELLDAYTEENDMFTLYADLQEEMTNNGFLKSLFQRAKEQAETEKPKKTTKKKTTVTE